MSNRDVQIDSATVIGLAGRALLAAIWGCFAGGVAAMYVALWVHALTRLESIATLAPILVPLGGLGFVGALLGLSIRFRAGTVQVRRRPFDPTLDALGARLGNVPPRVVFVGGSIFVLAMVAVWGAALASAMSFSPERFNDLIMSLSLAALPVSVGVFFGSRTAAGAATPIATMALVGSMDGLFHSEYLVTTILQVAWGLAAVVAIYILLWYGIAGCAGRIGSAC